MKNIIQVEGLSNHTIKILNDEAERSHVSRNAILRL